MQHLPRSKLRLVQTVQRNRASDPTAKPARDPKENAVAARPSVLNDVVVGVPIVVVLIVAFDVMQTA